MKLEMVLIEPVDCGSRLRRTPYWVWKVLHRKHELLGESVELLG